MAAFAKVDGGNDSFTASTKRRGGDLSLRYVHLITGRRVASDPMAYERLLGLFSREPLRALATPRRLVTPLASGLLYGQQSRRPLGADYGKTRLKGSIVETSVSPEFFWPAIFLLNQSFRPGPIASSPFQKKTLLRPQERRHLPAKLVKGW
jgi:hypothetical protein